MTIHRFKNGLMSPGESADDDRYAEERIAVTDAMRRGSRPEWDVVDLMRWTGNIVRAARSWSLDEDEARIVQFHDDWGSKALLRAMSDVLPDHAGIVPRGLILTTEG